MYETDIKLVPSNQLKRKRLISVSTKRVLRTNVEQTITSMCLNTQEHLVSERVLT